MASTEQLLSRLQNRFGAELSCTLDREQITCEVQANALLRICLCLRDELDFQFEQLIDICGVDYLTYGVGEWATSTATSEGFSRGAAKPDINQGPRTNMPNPKQRYAAVYHLLSIAHNQRLRLRVYPIGDPPRLPTLIDIWASANWYEREAFDLFGILFDGHPDLRRILTDYGFIGHPFRKDFPLIGQVEMRYDATQARVVYEPVSIEPRTLVPKIIRAVGAKEKTDG